MKRLAVLSAVLLSFCLLNCDGDDSEPPQQEVSPFLFEKWAKGQTISTCSTQNLPTTINHPKGFYRLELNDDFSYSEYISGDLSQAGTFSANGANINFEPSLQPNIEIISMTYIVVENSLRVTTEANVGMAGRCVITDRFSIADD